jgi:hypothetical protein
MRKDICLIALLLFSSYCLAQTHGAASAAASPAPAASVANRAKQADIHKLMQLMGAKQLISQVMEQVLQQETASVEKSRPDIPPDFWTHFQDDVRQEIHAEELQEMMVPIYEKHFTRLEIRQLIVFYQSPVGRKMTASLPAIQVEFMQVGEKWGALLGNRLDAIVAKHLQEKGYKIEEAPKPQEKD